jgi:hypothetical protein
MDSESFFRKGDDDPGRLDGTYGESDLVSKTGRIRCPCCNWQPRAHDRWQCSCDHIWNTFDTRGVCPACSRQWHDTQCLRCHAWAKHEAWYA